MLHAECRRRDNIGLGSSLADRQGWRNVMILLLTVDRPSHLGPIPRVGLMLNMLVWILMIGFSPVLFGFNWSVARTLASQSPAQQSNFPTGNGYDQSEKRSAPADPHRPTRDETSNVSSPGFYPRRRASAQQKSA